MNKPDYDPDVADQDEYGNTTAKNQDSVNIVLSANDKLDIALSILTERQVTEFAELCADAENSYHN